MLAKTISVERKTIHDVTLRYAHKPGVGEPILFCNGISASLETAYPIITGSKRPVVTFDVPGVGGSPIPKKLLRLKDLSLIANRLMTSLGYQDMIVLGYSWGGALAQQIARDHPRSTLALGLASTTTGTFMVPTLPWNYMQFARPGNIFAEVNHEVLKGIKQWAGEIRRDAPEDLVKLASNRKGFMYQMAMITGWTSLHWLHTLQMPALVVQGRDDTIVEPVNAVILEKRLGNAHRLMIDGQGHMVLMNRAEEILHKLDAIIL